MSNFDSSKRQRIDECHSSTPTPGPSAIQVAEAGSSVTELVSGPSSGSVADSEPPISIPPELSATHDLLERLMAKQDRLAADVVRLQSTIDAVLSALRHTPAPHQTPQFPPPHSWTSTVHSDTTVPPTLANIVLQRNEPANSPQPKIAPQEAKPVAPASPSLGPTASSVSPRPRHPHIYAMDMASEDGASIYTVGNNNSHSSNQMQNSREFQRPRARDPTALIYSTPPPPPPPSSGASLKAVLHPTSLALPPPAAMARAVQAGGMPPGIRSPPPPLMLHGHSRSYQQQQPTTPVSASLASSSPLSNVRVVHAGQQQQQQQRLSGLSISSSHYQPPAKTVAHSLQQPGQQLSLHVPAASPSRMSHHRLGQHTELSLSLPPIRASSSNAHPHAAIPRGSLSQSYSSSAPLVHPGALANATHAAPKPSPSPHQLLLPAISGLVRAPPTTPDGGGSAFIAAATAPASPTPNAMESPTGSSTGGLASGARGNATPGGSRSYSGSQSGGIGAVVSQQKVEKNRFQANIRAFVDHLFIAQPAARWDYKQSFKAPRNAHVTHHVIQSFHAAYGGSYERIEHGLGVYFSSLKAKHRTTDDKAMMKQQRDRRRARRIKKAAGRRKVFDYAQYPFLPADFDAQLCFVPSAMSPEHTDDDGEVKVGGLPWRSQTFTKLFRHLDTLRPKRTVRPTNPNLNSDALPLPDVPSFMLDQAYLAIERTYQPHDSEDDIEMGTSSDEAGSPSGSTVYM